MFEVTEKASSMINKFLENKEGCFLKSVMPSFCGIFSKNPAKMMAEMVPLGRDMMKSGAIS
jgi:hypothetical protein